ncbi:unnamed protein product [Clavelina lepadiformis]|uniref:THAP-type domain-containing protein n=1 Tax=Clavelina lepadiformis TaxID=159417 RepID=A0ABP0FKN8_CLALP
MPRICCMPECNNCQPQHNLFSAPNKKFCIKIKEAWAEVLERKILSYREDKFIQELYSKDQVKICEDHFVEEDIIMKGTRKELRIGAIPTLKLPKKSVEVKKIPERRQPKERILPSKVYSTGLMDIRQQVKDYLRKPWLCNDKGNYVEFELKEQYDQVKYLVAVNENLDVVVIYYGWIVTFTERKFDLKSIVLFVKCCLLLKV